MVSLSNQNFVSIWTFCAETKTAKMVFVVITALAYENVLKALTLRG
jgi:hypothetical protein